jgi:Spy/CpxP family protein refolding chaperone
MKTFLKLLLSALAFGVLATSPALFAQEQGGQRQGGQRQGGQRQGGGPRGGGRGGLTVAAIEQAVGTLTAEQKSKITAIIEKAQKDRQAIMSGGGDQQENRTKMQELMANERKDIRAVLTEEQAKKFDEMPAPGRGRGQGGGGGGGRRQGGGGGGGN